MAPTRRPAQTRESARQATQQHLVDKATKLPGVAEALDAYSKVERYSGTAVEHALPPIRYASGGNSPENT